MLTWIDLETTGFDERKGLILEIALVVTDNDLNELHAESHVLPFELDADPAFKVDPYVRAMHDKNGLWVDCGTAWRENIDPTEVYVSVLNSLRRFTERGTTPICGSTVAFDRKFLRSHAPAVEAHFSHRNFDVSVIGEVAKRWYPEAYEKRPRPGEDAHRALADIRGSVELMKYWRGTVLR